MAGAALVVLALVVAGQWWLIWKLLDRALLAARLPTLTPVPVPKKEKEEDSPPTKRRLFSIPLSD